MPSLSEHGNVLKSPSPVVGTVPAAQHAPQAVQDKAHVQSLPPQSLMPGEDEEQNLSQAERLTLGYIWDLDATYVPAFQQTVLNPGLLLEQSFVVDALEPPQKRASPRVPKMPKISLQVPFP